MERAERWIGLTDGGNGLENFMQVNFPRDLVLILDFWHASEYLADLAKLLHPQAAGETHADCPGERGSRDDQQPKPVYPAAEIAPCQRDEAQPADQQDGCALKLRIHHLKIAPDGVELAVPG